jgi:NADH:ubiquinone oxidoreductase subunit K
MLTRTLSLAFAAALAGAVRQRHSLPLLLCLESAVIICFVTLVLWPEMIFAAILLSVGAVEGAVGLGCLVGLVRAHGRELARV